MDRKEYSKPTTNRFEDNRLLLDLTFITNEPGKTLKDRFKQLIKDCEFFDCLVAYFCVSGFHAIYKPLQKTERIRILVGIATSRGTYDLIRSAEDGGQNPLLFSHAETKQKIEDTIKYEMTDSEDNQDVEEGVQKFIEWIKEGKLQIRAYPSQNIHAKLYIMTFREGDRDKGRVITGSSNFTQSGLIDNLEFNVELKNRSDYEFAKYKFEELWKTLLMLAKTISKQLQKKPGLIKILPPMNFILNFYTNILKMN